jgi:hypothetical protein
VIYPPSDFVAVTVPAEGEYPGCGLEHRRPVDTEGRPVQPWALACSAGCEDWLIARDDRWSKTVHDIRPTYDEGRAEERLAIEGPKEQAALMTAALAQLAGFAPAQIPPSLQRHLAGLRSHVPLPGQLVCASCSASSPAGQRFCGACGQPMAASAAAAAIASGSAA